MTSHPPAASAPTITRVLPEHFLTPSELADLLTVPLDTLYQWRRKRMGPPGFRCGRHLRYDPAQVRAWIDSQTGGAA